MKHLLFITTAISLLSVGTASAADFKPYTGAGLGIFELDPGQNKKTSFGGFAFAGLDLHEYLAVEVRAGIGGTKGREERGPLTEAFKVNWFISAFAKPKFELAADFAVYGLLGITNMSTSITPAASVIQTSSNNTGLSFGLGASYQVMDQLSVGTEWVRYSSNGDAATKNTPSFKGLDVNGFTATLSYQF